MMKWRRASTDSESLTLNSTLVPPRAICRMSCMRRRISVLYLSPDDGYLQHAHAVGGEGVQAEEAPLAGDLTGVVEPLDADVVHVGRPVDDGARVGLGEVEEVGRVGELPNLRRQLGEALRD